MKVLLKSFCWLRTKIVIADLFVVMSMIGFFSGSGAMANSQQCEFLFSKSKLSQQADEPYETVLAHAFGERSEQEIFDQFKSMTTSHGVSLESLFAASAGVSEGYTIEQHTRMVLAEMKGQWPSFKLIFNPNVVKARDLENLLQFAILLHDIGKPLAIAHGNKDLQHQYTIPILSEMADRFHLNEKDKDLVLALVGNDILGEFVKGRIDSPAVIQELTALAATTQLRLQDYFKLQLFFYTVDAASYPSLKKNLFFTNSENMLILVSSQVRELEVTILGQEFSRLNQDLIRVNRRLIKSAKNLMDRQHAVVESLLQTSGYGSLGEIKVALSHQPENKKLNNFIKDPHSYLQFALHRPSLARDSIAVAGFRSIHQTGLTQGGSSFDGSVEMRAAVEASYLNLSVSEYKALGPGLMAQFGYLRANPQVTGMRPPLVGYGEDVWIFKQAPLEDFVTLSAGDSLNKWRDSDNEDAVLSKSRSRGPLKSWDQLFIPWRDRALVSPLMTIQNSELDGRKFEILTASNVPSIPLRGLSYPLGSEYIELQYWRPLGLEDVQAFEFRTQPPSGKFLEELKAHHIKIYDGRLDEDIREWSYDGQKLTRNPDWPPQKMWPPRLWTGDPK